MPKEIKDLKKFMELLTETKEPTSKNPETKRPVKSYKKSLTIKRNKKITKFKLRTKKALITYQTTDGKIIKNILSHLPASITKTEVKNKKITKKTK